jgi:hypothetical protein
MTASTQRERSERIRRRRESGVAGIRESPSGIRRRRESGASRDPRVPERDLRNFVQYLTTAYEGRDLEHVLEPLTRLRRRSPGTPTSPVTPTV